MKMKTLILTTFLCTTIAFGQESKANNKKNSFPSDRLLTVVSLNQKTAFDLLEIAQESAADLNKKVAVAILDASGTLILLTRDSSVGPHNMEAARKKAFTALSTKTATLQLSKNAASNADTQNLNTLPDLLLLGGGVPIWHNNQVVGSIGIAGAGGPENDDLIAKSATLEKIKLK